MRKIPGREAKVNIFLPWQYFKDKYCNNMMLYVSYWFLCWLFYLLNQLIYKMSQFLKDIGSLVQNLKIFSSLNKSCKEKVQISQSGSCNTRKCAALASRDHGAKMHHLSTLNQNHTMHSFFHLSAKDGPEKNGFTSKYKKKKKKTPL